MAIRKECVAMLLAGGQGSRLYVLTEKVAKPAIPFGGKYRLIDFPLSNCVNSDVDTVGVLTQYQPHALNAYVGSGQPWDLDRLDGGVHVLPPYVKGKDGQWYKGSANAVYQNIGFIEQYDPDYVLVLGGDNVYKMDYSKMIRLHKRSGADCTIAVTDVTYEEAKSFGIMNVDEEDIIVEFQEKPKKPKSTLASMGNYVFTWKKLREYLIDDEADPKSVNDFGKNIIPNMLNAGEKMIVYRFNGYWKDVGTIDSLWESNMDMLAGDNDGPLNLFDPEWKIYSRNPIAPPHYTGETAEVSHSLLTEGCEVFGTVENSVLFNSVTVEEGAAVRYSIVMPGAYIESGATVEYSIIAEDARICRGAKIGGQPGTVQGDEWGIAVVASGVSVPEGTVLPPKEMISTDGSAKKIL